MLREAATDAAIAAITGFAPAPAALASQYEFLAAPQINLSLVYRLDKLTGDVIACQFAHNPGRTDVGPGAFGVTTCYRGGDGATKQEPGEYGLIATQARAGGRRFPRRLSHRRPQHLLSLFPAREAGRSRSDRRPICGLHAGVEIERNARVCRRAFTCPRRLAGAARERLATALPLAVESGADEFVFAREQDTIFAPATGVGRAAIAVLRISGPDCAAALRMIAPGAEFPDRRAILHTLRRPGTGEPLDRALITRFMAPRSFTGEEMAEVSVTGGRAVTAAVVKALNLIPGLRLAEPGEFAWRAFINGKIDLSEVEGLADLVEAETEAQRRQAQRIAGGALGRECEAIRASLLEAMAAIEAQIDFSDVEDASGLTLDSVRRAARAGGRANRPGARDRGRRGSACARASPSSSPGLPMSASRR